MDGLREHPGLLDRANDARGPRSGCEESDVLQLTKVDYTVLVSLQSLGSCPIIEVMAEVEVNENSSLRFSVFTSYQILELSIDVSQESLTEVVIV